jgi:hypothetical protein
MDEKKIVDKERNEITWRKKFIEDHVKFENDNGYDHAGSEWLKRLCGFEEKEETVENPKGKRD